MTRLRECREKAGYSQKQVAITLGLSGPSVSNWEKGKTSPTRDNITRLADLYGVSVDYLLGRTDEPRGETDTEQPIQMTDAEYALSMRYRKLSEKSKRDILNFMAYTESLEQDKKE